ncbi:MAG: DUF429 domain-containing protein [Caldivirga sp.]
MSRPAEIAVGGIDLSVVRKSGVAVVRNDLLKGMLVATDDEIISTLSGVDVVAIDAPLSGPGRYRDLDRAMLKLGLRVMPANWPWMIKLSERAVRIKSRLEDMGVKVIETHPTSVLKWIGLNLTQLSRVMGIRVLDVANNRDVHDAAVCALVALAYTMGKVRRITANDGELYLIEF